MQLLCIYARVEYFFKYIFVVGIYFTHNVCKLLHMSSLYYLYNADNYCIELYSMLYIACALNTDFD